MVKPALAHTMTQEVRASQTYTCLGELDSHRLFPFCSVKHELGIF